MMNEVLLKGTRCGYPDRNKPGDPSKELTILQPYYAEGASRHLVYGQKCYVNETNIDGCNLYIKPQLPLFAERNASCPFGDGICKNETGNLILDTGYLDSNSDLGINAPPKHRFQLRIVHQCAPIKTQGFTTTFNDSEYGTLMRYHYGAANTSRGNINFTYTLPVNGGFLPSGEGTSVNIPRLDYGIGSVFSRLNHATN